MSNLAAFLRDLIKPFLNSGLDAYRHYLDVTKRIVIQRNAVAARPYHRLFCLGICLILQCLLHGFVDQSDRNAIILGNIWHFTVRDFRRSISLAAILVILNAAYFYWSFYLSVDPNYLVNYLDALFEPHKYRWLYRSFRGKSCSKRMQTFAAVLMDCLRLFYPLVIVTWIYAKYLFFGAIYANRDYFFRTSIGFGGYMIHWIMLIALGVGLMAFAFVCVQVLAMGMVGLTVVHMHAIQQNHLLRSCRDPVTAVTIFIPHDVHLFQSVFIGNRVFGRLFLCFLLLHSPINAFCVMLLLTGSLQDPFHRLFCGVFVFAELVCILVAHFYIASLTDRVYRSAILLLRIAASRRLSTESVRFKLRLANNIERLHTKNKVGICYGNLALVTVVTFGKCLILYSEFLIYLLQLMRNYY